MRLLLGFVFVFVFLGFLFLKSPPESQPPATASRCTVQFAKKSTAMLSVRPSFLLSVWFRQEHLGTGEKKRDLVKMSPKVVGFHGQDLVKGQGKYDSVKSPSKTCYHRKLCRGPIFWYMIQNGGVPQRVRYGGSFLF